MGEILGENLARLKTVEVNQGWCSVVVVDGWSDSAKVPGLAYTRTTRFLPSSCKRRTPSRACLQCYFP